MKHPIAIVGIGCRFAGAPDVHAYWQLTVEGRNAFGPVPSDRWSHEQFFDANARATDKSYAPNGAFIEDIRSFPALALGIPPRRVEVMDPQQRHSILVAREAIQDAGYRTAELPRRTGVYVGVTASEWRTLLGGRVVAQLMASGDLGDAPAHLDEVSAAVQNIVPSRPFSAPGALANMIAAAVAQELDLHGPAFTVDAACASGMVAVENAVMSLRAGTVDCAVAGGVYLALSPENHIAFSRIGAISKSGVCRPFDARADGFVQGDGAGALVLKRLEDAERDGDRIYAVISGIASNNDGRGDGPMAPILDGQVEAIRRAWDDAGADRAHLGYVETHGTGTSVGDQTEFTGLMNAFGDAATEAAIGSSKGNVGHTMSAAGIAGLVRTALAIHHGQVPPMANFDAAKDTLGLEESPFYVPTSARAWDGPRVAGVSSFGFGGTNVHAVLQQAPVVEASTDAQPELLLWSARDTPSLRAVAADLAATLRAGASIPSVARSLAARTALQQRAALVTGSLDETLAQLDAFASDGDHDVRTGASAEPARLALLFPGQGAQRVGMLADARKRFPILEQTFAEVDGALGLPVPITHLLDPSLRTDAIDDDTAHAAITDTANCQPVMYACSLGLHRLLTQVGVDFMAATGHSLGEFNAAVAGGVLSAEDGARFVTARGRGMSSVTGDTGSMAAVMADRDTVQDLVVDGVVLANINHPRQVVISGTTAGVATVAEKATLAGITAKPLSVSHAFHSQVFDGLDATPWLEGVELSDPGIVVASGIDSQPYADADAARSVFERHTRSPVDFVGALHQLVDAGADLLLQVGAGGPLASFARGTVGDRIRGVQTLGKRRDDDGGTGILEGLGWLWCNGVTVDVRPITAPAPVVSLHPEILPSESYWAIKAKRQKSLKLKATSAPEVHLDDASPPVVATAPVQAEVDADQQKVFEVVAKVSAYPLDALKPTMRLLDDLGFDSLMVGDMATGLADAFPGLGGIPQELLINSPTVQDLIDFVKTAGDAVEVDDDAPLKTFALAWTPAGLVAPSGRDVRGHVAWVDDGLATVAADLRALGIECTTDRDEAADLLVWRADGDRSGELAALVANQLDRGAHPDLIVLAGADDHHAEADAGVARSYAAEQDVVSKTLWGDGAAHVGAEWLDCERSLDVRYDGQVRSIRTFVDAPTVDRAPLGPDDTVLITGGTRGIGLKLAHRLAARGCSIVLMARSTVAIDGMASVQADVSKPDSVTAALEGRRITAVVHAAGVLADGPIETVDATVGARARAVKIGGLDTLLAACPDARVVLAIGSWAGRFGNRHQAHYAAGNAGMAARAMGSDRVVVSEFGPWTDSDMVRTIPAAIQATMRSEGVDFVGDDAGLNALLGDLDKGAGVRTHGREMPLSTRAVRQRVALSTTTHPYLLDHAIQGTPVLPLAAATDLMATAAGPTTPFEVTDLRLYQGVTVSEPATLEVRVRGDRAEIRVGDRKALAYRARIRPVFDAIVVPEAPAGGAPPTLSLAEFYDGKTFHGPLLQGILSIDTVGPTFVAGRVRRGTPSEWVPADERPAFTVDPLALDSAMQLSGYVALTRFERAGTPVGIGRLVQLAPLPAEMLAEVHFGDREDDRFAGTIVLRDLDGTPVLLAEQTVAELRKLVADDLGDFEAKPEWVDFAKLPGLIDLDVRLQMAEMGGIRNPYFAVHEGTARDTTSVGGRELINFSSYNYIGLSGDPRVVKATQDAVAKFGTSVSASRVASGERPFHHQLERLISECQDVEDALVFTAGHATNVTAVGHLMGPGDLILHDEFIHDSILQGAKLAGCARRGFKHDDPADLESQLRELRTHYEKVLIIVEGVYSMDGDIADLPAYIALKRKYQCLLMCDEAHSFGVVGATGRGVHEHFGFSGSDVDIWMGTLSKSVSSCGGWIGGSKALIRYLRYTAPGFVYSAGITPANGVAAVRSLELMVEEPWRVEKLQANAQHFHDELVARGIDTGPAKGGSAVIPTITGNSLHALFLSQRLADAGINAQPIVYPAVADDSARLRFFLSSTHSFEQLTHTASEVARLLGDIRKEFPSPT